MQIFGTPMGSPISPLFADIVMDDLENDCLRILKDKHNCSPLFYYTFVDDTILCVDMVEFGYHSEWYTLLIIDIIGWNDLEKCVQMIEHSTGNRKVLGSIPSGVEAFLFSQNKLFKYILKIPSGLKWR